MGEGENGPSHFPLSKVVVRSQDGSLKSSVNKNKQKDMASKNYEYSDFPEISTKPIDIKMMTTSNLASESSTNALFPPFPSNLFNRLSSRDRKL